MVHFDDIAHLCTDVGLTLVGVTDCSAIVEHRAHLQKWQANGFAAEMSYMQRDPELFVSPSRFLEGAKSIISLGLIYESRPHPPMELGFGRVARYAWGRDYHLVIRSRLDALEQRLSSMGKTRSFTDSVPLLERAFAEKAGVGFIGKNSLLIRPKIGSHLFLAEVILDFEIDGVLPVTPFEGCKSCELCKVHCPTHAIVEDKTVDARRCISYLTIEKRGNFAAHEGNMIGEWLFGCDVCQDVCPYNHQAIKIGQRPTLKEFSKRFGTGPLVSLEEVLSISSNEEFKKRFVGTPLLRAKRSGLIRNACAVSINTGYERAVVHFEKLLQDTDPIVRQAAEEARNFFR